MSDIMVVELKKIFVLLIVGCCTFSSYGQTVDVLFDDVDVQMTNITSCFSGNLYDESGGRFVGDGIVYFRNELPVDIEIAYGSDLSALSLNMQGSANSFLNCEGLELYNLELNTAGSDLFLNGDLTLLGGLSLFSGKLLSGTGGVLSILNTSESSIIFNDVVDNASYIGLALKRKVLKGGTYSFPIGDANAYHPLILTDLDGDDQIMVEFSSVIVENWKTIYEREDLMFPLLDGWRVEADFGANYRLGLSRIDINEELIEGEMAVFHVSDIFNALEYPTVDYTPLEIEPFYLASSNFMGDGMYTLVGTDFDLKENGYDIQFINTIVANGTSQTFFIIPEIQKYERIDVKVYNFSGELVFASNEYANDFNSINYPNGTYYYDMVI
ncbi:MAG: gliding motility-associated C-terminal domain-containing protein, partial [Labilibaculum sp.]|nr:gliding motility-associated C-terminal domain-containing protein [Labilibaculum sp.]